MSPVQLAYNHLPPLGWEYLAKEYMKYPPTTLCIWVQNSQLYLGYGKLLEGSTIMKDEEAIKQLSICLRESDVRHWFKAKKLWSHPDLKAFLLPVLSFLSDIPTVAEEIRKDATIPEVLTKSEAMETKLDLA